MMSSIDGIYQRLCTPDGPPSLHVFTPPLANAGEGSYVTEEGEKTHGRIATKHCTYMDGA